MATPLFLHTKTMPSEVTSTSYGQTMILTLSHPEHGNALSPSMYAAAVEALNVAGDNDEVRSIVITGAGRTFSTGVHQMQMQTATQPLSALQIQSLEGLQNWMEELCTFPKPIIAAVEGEAYGAGFSLALACDMIVAAHDATFGCPTGSSFPAGGAAWHITRRLPSHAGNELLLCGGALHAERLYQWGIVNRLCDSGAALDQALVLAQEIGKRPARLLEDIKGLQADAQQVPLPKYLAAERAFAARASLRLV
jgi:enoyl-CoA hydratase/carnithine racemase